MLDQAFETLKTYDWDTDRNVLQPIEQALVTTRDDATARKDLDTRLAGVLESGAPRAAKDYACRALRTVGTAAAVPALAKLLPDEALSHMARYALERIPAPEAGEALREAMPKVAAKLKCGIASSLGTRAEAASIPLLQNLLADGDPAVVRAAAEALGAIGTNEAHHALVAARPNKAVETVIADALLARAAKQLAGGNKPDAKATYERLLARNPPPPAQAAAKAGLTTCATP
jgi:HEAT repeat protein